MPKKEQKKEKSIKDFIYLDVERLYSLYSQVYEGIAETIIKSKQHSELQKGTQKGNILKGDSAEEEYGKVVQMTENTILYDYMYEQLEQKLKTVIHTPSEITSENFREKLKNVFIIKVAGKAEIADFERLNSILENFNSLGEGIAYFNSIEKLGGLSPDEAKKLMLNTPKSSQRQETLNYIKNFENTKEVAKRLNLWRDEKSIKYLLQMTKTFYPNGLEIIISPDEKEKVKYRGVIDKKWLRIESEFLRHLFGGYTEFDWTMVGQITYLPNEKLPASIPDNEEVNKEETEKVLESADAAKDQNKPISSMRDSFSDMYKALDVFEKFFSDRSNVAEVVIQPLAIYRETVFSIPDE